MSKTKTALQKARESMGFTCRRVAEAIGMDVSGLLRIETAENAAKQETARKIHAFYLGAIPLGVIYDPAHKSSFEWLRQEGTRELLATTASKLIREHQDLAVRILDPRVDPRRRRKAGQLAEASKRRDRPARARGRGSRDAVDGRVP
jgi:transcriptional regulator with XRE-family HTH domain